MNDVEKLTLAFRKLAEENAALKARLDDMVTINDWNRLIEVISRRFSEVEEMDLRAMTNLTEIIAGHELALIELGANPEPVQDSAPEPTPTAEVDPEQTDPEPSSAVPLDEPADAPRPPPASTPDDIDLSQWPEYANRNMPMAFIHHMIRQKQRDLERAKQPA